jgi:hypothetical protein
MAWAALLKRISILILLAAQAMVIAVDMRGRLHSSARLPRCVCDGRSNRYRESEGGGILGAEAGRVNSHSMRFLQFQSVVFPMFLLARELCSGFCVEKFVRKGLI